MSRLDPCLIDSSIWIEAQSDPQWFAALIEDHPDAATCQVAVAEYCVGLYAPEETKTRAEARDFFEQRLQAVAFLPHVPDDFQLAPRLVGDAIRANAGRPNIPDGLIAACALRTNRRIWTKDKHFAAMGCKVFKPLEDTPRHAPA